MRDRGEVSLVKAPAEAVLHGAQEPDAEADPCLRVGVAVRRDAGRFLSTPEQVRNVGVHLAEMPAKVTPHLRVVPGDAERLDPDVAGNVSLALERLLRLPERQRPLPRVRLVRDDLFDGRPQPRPGLVETREGQIPLRREVAIEDRLRHPRLARDLGGRCAAVAPAGEDAQTGVDQRCAPLAGGEADLGRRFHHAAASATAGASAYRTLRTVRTATIAPASAIAAAT